MRFRKSPHPRSRLSGLGTDCSQSNSPFLSAMYPSRLVPMNTRFDIHISNGPCIVPCGTRHEGTTEGNDTMADAPKRTKQVLVMRHDLKMRRGKQIAQGAHASMSFICRRLQETGSVSFDDFTEAQLAWLTSAFAKVCCRVNSEDELMEIHDKALKAGLEVHLITDSGKTEFHGEPTNTCLAIGPDEAEKIDEITGHLQLL